MALEKVYDYFHNYDKQTYQVVACMGNEPSEQDIKNFENQYGINLPSDFREFTMSPTSLQLLNIFKTRQYIALNDFNQGA